MVRRATAPCPADQSHGGHIVGRDSLRRWKDRGSSLHHVTPRSCRLHGAVLAAAPCFFVAAQARKQSVSDRQVRHQHTAACLERYPLTRTQRRTAMKTKLIESVTIALALA